MKNLPLFLFTLIAAALTSGVNVAARPSSHYSPPVSSPSYTLQPSVSNPSYAPPLPVSGPSYAPHPVRNEWVACVFNQTDRPRQVQVLWHSQRGVKDRCTETTTIAPSGSAVFRCQFRQSDPRAQLAVYGLRSGNLYVNSWINSGVRDGRRECGRSNSSTIVGQGRNVQVISNKPRR
jgi:hypothetical protein